MAGLLWGQLTCSSQEPHYICSTALARVGALAGRDGLRSSGRPHRLSSVQQVPSDTAS